MNLNLKDVKISFIDILQKHEKLYETEKIDPETIAESRLNLIREAKKSYDQKDSPEAIYWYGRCLATGEEAFPVSIDEAIRYLNQAVMMRHTGAYSMLGDIYSAEIAGIEEEMIDLEKAIKNYKAAAKENDGYASFRLASIYSGELGYPKDIRQALDYIDKSVDQGSDDGLCLKAYWMYSGDLLEKDLDKIYDMLNDLMERSEESGFGSYDALAKAFFLSGHLLYNGEGSDPDPDEALKFMRDSASLGDLNAIQWLRDYDLENS